MLNKSKLDKPVTKEEVAAALPVVDTTNLVKGSEDGTKQVRIEADGLTPSTTRVLTMPDKDLTPAEAGSNSDITSMSGLTQITRATGGPFDIAIGEAAGDDFTVATNKLVVEGDSGNVGIGTIVPGAKLEVNGNGEIAIFQGANAADQRMTFKSHASAGYGPQMRFQHQGTNGVDYGFISTGVDDTGGAGALSIYDFTTNAARLFINPNGNVGIGTIVPGSKLAVNIAEDGTLQDFEVADAVEGNITVATGTVSYNAFCGSHYTQLKDGQKELPVGAVVISTGEIVPCEANIEKTEEIKTEIAIKDAFEDIEVEEDKVYEVKLNGKIKRSKKIIEEVFDRYVVRKGRIVKVKKPVYEKVKITKRQLKVNHSLASKTGKIFKTETVTKIVSLNVSNKEYFPYIDTTNVVGDKRVYGVWLGKLSDDSKGAAFGKDDKPVYLIAQVGLFKIRVTDTNSNIKVGDFLETSIRPMEAQRQISVQKETSTIAKAMMDVDWNTVEVDSELGYKWKLIPCIF